MSNVFRRPLVWAIMLSMAASTVGCAPSISDGQSGSAAMPDGPPLSEEERSRRYGTAYPQTLADGPGITQLDGTPHQIEVPDAWIWSEAQAIQAVKELTGVDDWLDYAVTPTDQRTWYEFNRQEPFITPEGLEDAGLGRVWVVGFVADGGITNAAVQFAPGPPMDDEALRDRYTAEGLIVAIDDRGSVIWHLEIEDINLDLWKEGVEQVPEVPVQP